LKAFGNDRHVSISTGVLDQDPALLSINIDYGFDALLTALADAMASWSSSYERHDFAVLGTPRDASTIDVMARPRIMHQ